MAMESPVLIDGWSQISTADMRNSTLSGTTRAGLNGSGQYLAVKQSTVTAGVFYATTLNGQTAYGVLQNKPNVGEVGDIAIYGLTKVVATSTSLTAGGDVMVDTQGGVIPYSSAAGQARFGRLVSGIPGTTGEVVTIALYGIGQGPGSIA